MRVPVFKSFPATDQVDVAKYNKATQECARTGLDTTLHAAGMLMRCEINASTRMRRLPTRDQAAWIDPSTVTAITPRLFYPGESIVFHVGPVTVLGNPDDVFELLFGPPAVAFADALSEPLAATSAEAFSGERSEP